jgi:hypothetical protein
MRKIHNVILAVVATLFIYSCSDSDSFDPYKNQTIRPFYPTALTFSSLNNENTQTDKNWKFKYNADNSINSYSYTYKVKTNDGVEINEEHQGTLTYYTDAAGNGGILNKLVVNNQMKEITATQGYCDTITEDAKIVAGKIESIKSIVQRTYLNGETTTFSTNRTFTYTDKYCTSSTITTPEGSTTYTYKWSNAGLSKATVYTRNNNDIIHETYEYTYSKELATDYKFNTLSFIYGNMPEIYAAMSLFGETSAYKLEGEHFNGYRTINNEQHNLSPTSRQYTILETTNSVTYTADSPGTSTYFYTFSNN